MKIIALTKEMFYANPVGCIAEHLFIIIIMMLAISYLIDSFARYLYWKTKKPFFRHNPMFSDEEVDAYCAARIEELKKKLEKRNGRN